MGAASSAETLGGGGGVARTPATLPPSRGASSGGFISLEEYAEMEKRAAARRSAARDQGL